MSGLTFELNNLLTLIFSKLVRLVNRAELSRNKRDQPIVVTLGGNQKQISSFQSVINVSFLAQHAVIERRACATSMSSVCPSVYNVGGL